GKPGWRPRSASAVGSAKRRLQMCSTLFITVFVAAGLLDWLPASPDDFDAFTREGHTTVTAGARGDGQLYSVVVGTAGDRVAFVVIALGPPGGKPLTGPVG